MRVLFISRATLFTVRGGDTVQMEQTAAQLRLLGISVNIELCNNKNIDYRHYDLIHFFNIIRPADILYHIEKSDLPYVVSPIYVEYHEMQAIKGFQHYFISLFGKNTIEYLKVIARSVKNREKVISHKYLWWGQKRSIVYILRKSSGLLPNSQSEYLRLKRDYPIAGKYNVIPNAIDTSIFKVDSSKVKGTNTVLCVARFEPRKNQLNIIKALSGTDYNITFAGNVAPNHKAYYNACRNEAGNKVTFLDFATQKELATLYSINKVHILASWFETTGLSSLEAAACGCNIVISKNGDTEEYFGANAFYCDPGSTESIRKAVDKAMIAEVNETFIKHIQKHYNWEVTARETLKVYKEVLKT
jgi:glycosyltransferase involved in cell wall biosynthesis